MVGTRRKPCQPLVWHSAVLFLALHAALVCALPVSQTGLGPNQPPHIAVPAAISTTTRTTASLAGLHVTDPDVGDDFDGVLTVTIAPAMGGQVLLSSAAGLAVFVEANQWMDVATLVGTVASVNTALARLRYRSAPDYVGTEPVLVTADDSGFTGTGGAQVVTATLSVHVLASSTPPKPSFAALFVVTDEDEAAGLGLAVGGVRAGDVVTYRAIATVQVGRLSFPQASDDLVVVTDAGTGTTSLTGVAADVATALQSAVYEPAADWNSVLHGRDSVRVCIAPLDTPSNAQCATVSVSVSAVNDAPVLSVPAHVSQGVVVQEDGLVLIPGVAASDVDVSESFDGVLHVSLSCMHGTVQVASGLGLRFDGGVGSADGVFQAASLGFRGGLAAVNTALAGITYRPAASFTGDDTVHIEVGDLGFTGAGPTAGYQAAADVGVVVVAHNDAPTIEAPTSTGVSTMEDTPVAVAGVVVDDPDVGDDSLSVTLTVSHGTFSLGELTYWVKFAEGSGVDDASAAFTGPLADINAALAGLVYTPDADYNVRGDAAADELVVEVSDLGHNGGGGDGLAQAVVPIFVAPVNDAPELTVPAAAATPEDTPVALAGITVSDVDVAEDEGGALRFTVSAAHGRVGMKTGGLWVQTGTRVGDVDHAGVQWFDGAVTAIGALPSVQSALASVQYVGARDWTLVDTVTVTVTDQGYFGDGGEATAAGAIAVTVSPVNDAPTLSLPTPPAMGFRVAEDTPLELRGFAIADVDLPSASHLLSVTINVASGGTVSLASTKGIRLDGTPTMGAQAVSSSDLSFTGTLADLNAAVASITYVDVVCAGLGYVHGSRLRC